MYGKAQRVPIQLCRKEGKGRTRRKSGKVGEEDPSEYSTEMTAVDGHTQSHFKRLVRIQLPQTHTHTHTYVSHTAVYKSLTYGTLYTIW
jgi:hypothetical protein